MAGVALFVGPTAKPPDMACFEGLYRTCEELGAAVWVHPCRPQSYADYDTYKVFASVCSLSFLSFAVVRFRCFGDRRGGFERQW